ncbi:MAG: hypothetical protein HQL80_05720 [Magnetococcales bacterium]|nr:hypothetical protein [Magnetococcales bacterium]
MRKIYLARLEVELSCAHVARLELIAEGLWLNRKGDGDPCLSEALRLVLTAGWGMAEQLSTVKRSD